MVKDLDIIFLANLQEIFEVSYIIKAPKNYVPEVSFTSILLVSKPVRGQLLNGFDW